MWYVSFVVIRKSSAGQTMFSTCPWHLTTTSLIAWRVPLPIPETQFTLEKLQHEFKHAGDFGIIGNWNKSKVVEYQQAIENHISSATDIFISKYRGNDVYVYFNSNTQIGAYVDLQGSYVGGWKLSQEQINFHLNNGIKLY